MFKCFVFVLCAVTVVFCAPGYENLREKQSSRQEQVTDRLSDASRTKRQSLGKVDIVYLDAESIYPSRLKDLQSKESSRLAPVNDVTNKGQNQELSDSNLEIVSQNSNYIVYKLKSTDDSPVNILPDDKRAQASDNQYYNYDTGQYSGYSDVRNPPPPPPPDDREPPPPPPPPHHHHYPPPPPGHHYPPPPPPPDHYPPPPPPPHHHHPPPPPPSDDYYRSSYYDRPLPPPPPRSSYDDRSRRFYDDRQTRQSAYDRPPPPHRGGPPPHYGGPPPRDRDPPPRDGGRPPRYEDPPRHHGGPPPRDGPPDRYDRGPPPPPGGPPDRYDHRPPPHHGGPPDRYDHRPPPHHGGPPDRYDHRPPPPPDRYDDRRPPPRGGPPDRIDNRPPYDRRPPPPPDRDQYYNQGNENNEYAQNGDHSGKLTDVTLTSSTTEAAIDDNQYQLDVRFMDDEQKAAEDLKRDVAVTTARPFPPFIFQAAAVTPED